MSVLVTFIRDEGFFTTMYRHDSIESTIQFSEMVCASYLHQSVIFPDRDVSSLGEVSWSETSAIESED